MKLTIDFGGELGKIFSTLSQMEIKMAKVQDLIEAVKSEQNLVVSAIQVTNTLVEEVRTLVANANVVVPGLDELLADVQANSVALTEAISLGTSAEEAFNADVAAHAQSQPQDPAAPVA